MACPPGACPSPRPAVLGRPARGTARPLAARDAAEAHLVEELVFAAWRQVRLRAVEERCWPGPERARSRWPGLPSLATLMRYRARIDRGARPHHAGAAGAPGAAATGSSTRPACAGSPTRSSGCRQPARSARTNRRDRPAMQISRTNSQPGTNEPCLVGLWHGGGAPTPCRGWGAGSEIGTNPGP